MRTAFVRASISQLSAISCLAGSLSSGTFTDKWRVSLTKPSWVAALAGAVTEPEEPS
jgi:hypothetical protein